MKDRKTRSVNRKKDKFLLDTSAVFTLMEDEAGAERVQNIIRSRSVIIPFTVLLETHYVTFREQGQDVADLRYAMLKQLPADFIWEIDEPTLLCASEFKAMHDVSFADALIAAFAKRHNAVLIHKDPEFDALSEMIRQEHLPYK